MMTGTKMYSILDYTFVGYGASRYANYRCCILAISNFMKKTLVLSN